MRCAPRCRARAHGLCSCVGLGRGRPGGLPVGDHPLVGALVLGGDLALGSPLVGLGQPMSGRAASLVARGAEQQLDAAQLLAIERWAPERVLLAAAEQMPRDHDLRAVATVAILLPRRAAMRAWKARSGPGVRVVCQPASTSRLRTSAAPCLLIRPCLAGWVPDWRTRGSSPR